MAASVQATVLKAVLAVGQTLDKIKQGNVLGLEDEAGKSSVALLLSQDTVVRVSILS